MTIRAAHRTTFQLVGFALSLSLFVLMTSPSVEEDQLRKMALLKQTQLRHPLDAKMSFWMNFGDHEVELIPTMPIPRQNAGSYADSKSLYLNTTGFVTALAKSEHTSLRGPQKAQAVDIPWSSGGGVKATLSTSTTRKPAIETNLQEGGTLKPTSSTSFPSARVSRKARTATGSDGGKWGRNSFRWLLYVTAGFLIVTSVVHARMRRVTMQSELYPLIPDDESERSFSVTYSNSPLVVEAGYGTMVPSFLTGDIDKFDI